MAAYDTDAGGRLRISGPKLSLASSQASPLALIINELATNALKHGSLSVATGKVIVSWSVQSQILQFNWVEVDGPAVPVSSDGRVSGAALIRRLAEGPLKAKFTHVLARDGVSCSIRFRIASCD